MGRPWFLLNVAGDLACYAAALRDGRRIARARGIPILAVYRGQRPSLNDPHRVSFYVRPDGSQHYEKDDQGNYVHPPDALKALGQ